MEDYARDFVGVARWSATEKSAPFQEPTESAPEPALIRKPTESALEPAPSRKPTEPAQEPTPEAAKNNILLLNIHFSCT